MTSLKKRLDNVLNQLSQMDAELDEQAADNVVAQLSIIKNAFRESDSCPVCCFSYDKNSRLLCDSNGPLGREEFMKKCRSCQAQIKEALSILQNA
ncbi:MAG: hypothetical protein NWE98_00840 [Candidatus Bathyarchaeota archaeon]|nr:hypothetical protein [Candidatus Bathyarchaeota archaeon]